MEAMWIDFHCTRDDKFVLRPFLGGINGITGEGSTGDMSSLIRRMNKLATFQDYLVLPDQLWLDGISTSPGIVRQFVATEMAPPRRAEPEKARGMTRRLEKSRGQNAKASRSKSTTTKETEAHTTPDPQGASIEWQITGQDSVGGIQMQIIPMFDISSMFAGSVKDVCQTSTQETALESYDDSKKIQAHVFDVLRTPQDEGLAPGDIIHIKNMKTRETARPKVLTDLLDETTLSTVSEDGAIELEIMYKCSRSIFKIYLPGQSKPAIILEVGASCS
jgi:hypothetical protein